jgi:spoIIIJ-associated protein
MKNYSAKTLEEALAAAAQDFGQPVEELSYEVTEEKKGLFSKKVTIAVYELADAIDFAEKYLIQGIATFGITATTKAVLADDIIRISIDSDHNSILIGKNGKTLQALNELTKLAVSSKFKKRFRILLDINDYKDSKYEKLISIARRTAREVQKTKVPVTLEAMPADERRVIHNALNGMPNIKTESVGEGHHRQVTIKYVD